MASKKISYDDIAEKGLLDPLIKDVERLNELLGKTGDALKAGIKESAKLAENSPFESYQDAEDVAKAVDDVKDSVEKLDKVEKQRVKLQERLSELEDERVKRNFELREQIRLQTKALRDEAKANAANLNAYQKLTKQVNEAQNEYKKLAAQFGANSKEAREAFDQFTKLDEKLREINDASKNRRKALKDEEKALKAEAKLNEVNSNAYKKLTKQVNEAQNEYKRLAAEFGKNSKEARTALVEFTKLDEKLREINEAARDGRRDVGRYTNAIKNSTKAFKTFAKATLILQGLQLLTDLLSQNEVIVNKLTKAFNAISITLNVGVTRAVDKANLAFTRFKGLFTDTTEEVAKLEKEIEKKTVLSFAEQIETAVKASNDFVDSTAKSRKEIAQLQISTAKLIKTQAEQQVAADNATQSLQDQIAAQIQLNKTNDELARRNVFLAEKQVKLAKLNTEANLNSAQSQEELADAVVALAEAEAEQIALREEGIKLISELQRDALERNLDFYIDDFDNQKSVNERIIADNTQTFERRRALLEQTRVLNEEAFDSQEAAINESLQAQGRALLDFDELQKMTSSAEIARKIELSGLDDVLAGRALEIIKERRLANQDLAEAQRDLNAAEQESRNVQADLVLTNEALLDLQKEGVNTQEVLAELENKRLQQEIENLKVRKSLAEQGSEERLLIEQQLNEKLLEQQQKRIEKESEAEKERNQKRIEGIQEGLEAVSELSSQFFEGRVSDIDDEIEAEEKRAEKVEELAENGDETAKENLAKSQKRQAELAQARERELQRQRQAELALTAVTTYQSKVAAGEDNPLASTFTDIALLQAFIGQLSGFFEGTEDTGTNGIGLYDNHGAITGYTHANERVLTAAQNRMVGNMSNMELAMLAQNSRSGANISENRVSDPAVLNELRQLRGVMDNKPVYLGADFRAKQEAIVHHVAKKGRLERKHQKTGGIWGK